MSSVSVVEFLESAHRQHQALVRLAGDRTRIEVDQPAGRVPEEVLEAIRDRSQEILAHLLASPGLNIIGYPADLMLAEQGFQEQRLSERRKRHKVVDVATGGQAVTKWFEDPPGWRLREISYELELRPSSQQKEAR